MAGHAHRVAKRLSPCIGEPTLRDGDVRTASGRCAPEDRIRRSVTQGLRLTGHRSWWLNVTTTLLFVIGGLYGLTSLRDLLKLWFFTALPVSFISRTEVISALQHVVALTSFEVFMACVCAISGFGCLTRRRYQGRFLGTACALLLFLVDFVSIYVLDHYEIGLFIIHDGWTVHHVHGEYDLSQRIESHR